MIILNNSIYTINVITTTQVTIAALLIIIPLIWFGIISIVEAITKHPNLSDEYIVIFIFTIICFFLFIIGCIWGGVLLIRYIHSPNNELILYTAMEAEGKILQDIITKSNGILDNKKLYNEIIAFNAQLSANYQYANNPLYAPMRWSMDWLNIPKIII